MLLSGINIKNYGYNAMTRTTQGLNIKQMNQMELECFWITDVLIQMSKCYSDTKQTYIDVYFSSFLDDVSFSTSGV